MARLSEEQIKQIRLSELSSIKLAERYGVTSVTIWKIRTGRSHKQIAEQVPADQSYRAFRERTKGPKLDPSKAATIRASNSTAKELADQYGVTPAMIYSVRSGRSWS